MVAAVGAVDPQGRAITCQAEAVDALGFAACVHPNVAVVVKTVVAVNPVGFVQVGAGAQVIFATHPAAVTELSEVNTKVKHPPGVVDVIAGGIVVPW